MKSFLKNPINISKDRISILVLCALAVLSWIPRLNGPIDLRWDAGAYYILGTSIAEGKGYKLLSEPGEINSTLHQPLLPAIVAVHQWTLGTSDPAIVGQALRITFFLAFIIYVLTVYLMFRLYLTSTYAFIAALICLLHSNTLFFSDLLFAELFFALTTVIFFICFKKNDQKLHNLLSVLLAFAAYGLRTAGAALCAAWIGESLLNKNFRTAIFRLAVSLLPIACWQLYVYSIENGSQYQNPAYEYQRADYMYPNVSYARNSSLVDPFAPEKGYVTPTGRVKRFAENAFILPIKLGEAVSINQDEWQSYLKRIGRRVNLFPPDWIPVWFTFVVLLTLSFLVMTGAVLKLSNRQRFVPVYVSAYSALLCLTPWQEQFGRYLMPLMPFLILLLFEALAFVKAKSEAFLVPKWKLAGQSFAASVLALILLAEIVTASEIYRHHFLPVAYTDKSGRRIEHKLFYYHEPYRSLDEGLEWLAAQAKADDVVAGSWCHLIYLRTGLKAVLPPFELDAEKAQKLLDSVPVKYLLLEKDVSLKTEKYVSPVIENSRKRWKPVFSTSDGNLEIYERVGE